MKLCRKATAIREGYSGQVTSDEKQGSAYGDANARGTRKAMAQALNKHMSRCKECG